MLTASGYIRVYLIEGTRVKCHFRADAQQLDSGASGLKAKMTTLGTPSCPKWFLVKNHDFLETHKVFNSLFHAVSLAVARRSLAFTMVCDCTTDSRSLVAFEWL